MVTAQTISVLQQLNVETLQTLRSVLDGIDQTLYTKVNSKGNASVGQHVRHTLEFYTCLFDGLSVVNYDSRKRDILLESSAQHAMITIDLIIERVKLVNDDYPLDLIAGLPSDLKEAISVKSSLARELLYVLEHAIHHMALIRILIKDEAPTFELEDSFGVAYSTLAYRSHEANG